MSSSPRRIWLAGALTPPVLGLVLVAASAPFWPDIEGLKTPARILDSLAPQLLALALAGAGLLALAGARRTALLALVLALATAGAGAARHAAQSAPLAAGPADLTLLWFNVLGHNPTPPGRLVAALAGSAADVVILGEAAPLRGHLAALAEAFPYQAGCRPEARRCDMLVLSRRPLAGLEVLRIGRAREERMARTALTLPGRAPLTLLAIHMVKPWFFGFAEKDDWFAATTLRESSGPVVMAGDFNAAPWSRRMQALVRCCGVRFPRRPPATWPAAAGPFGVPIDHMLTAGGARLVSLAPWGEGLGSNHRGLLAGIALPPAPDADQGVTP